jgi:hypothetical protein
MIEPTTTPPAAKTEPVPPLTGWSAVWRVFYNWREITLFLPLSLFSIWAFAQGAYWASGRRPTENVDYVVGMSINLVKLVFLIVFLSILRESTGMWMTKEEKLENPSIVWAQTVGSSVALCVAAWVLQH